MPELEHQLAQMAHQKEREDARQAQEKAEIGLLEARSTFARLNTLWLNQDLQWFIDEHMRPLVTLEQQEALDVKNRTPEQRNEHAHRNDFGLILVNLLKQQRDYWQHKAKLDE